MVLISLLYKHFIDNLFNLPNNVIRVSKKSVSNIKTIHCDYEYRKVNLTSSSSTIDLSKLIKLSKFNLIDILIIENIVIVNKSILPIIDLFNGGVEVRKESVKINIEGLSSLKRLHLGLNSAEIDFSIRNLNSLIILSLFIGCTIDQNILTKLLDQLKHIRQLFLVGSFSYFNLDYLVNLEVLSLYGPINESFNIELLKNLCNQIMVLKIITLKIEDKTFYKLFDGLTFPNLKAITIQNCNLKVLKKEFINRFPILRKLFILNCNLEVIEQDAFSNLKQLYCLDFSSNHIKFIEKDTFSNLNNLKILDLSLNGLTNLDAEYIGVRNSVKVFLENKKNETFIRYWFKD